MCESYEMIDFPKRAVERYCCIKCLDFTDNISKHTAFCSDLRMSLALLGFGHAHRESVPTRLHRNLCRFLAGSTGLSVEMNMCNKINFQHFCGKKEIMFNIYILLYI